MTELERARRLIDRLPGRVGMVMAPFYLLVFGIRELLLVARLRRRGLIAEGTVVENVHSGDSSDGPDWSPVSPSPTTRATASSSPHPRTDPEWE
jgi:hypothetical protein